MPVYIFLLLQNGTCLILRRIRQPESLYESYGSDYFFIRPLSGFCLIRIEVTMLPVVGMPELLKEGHRGPADLFLLSHQFGKSI
jgi:hypothetical protein